MKRRAAPAASLLSPPRHCSASSSCQDDGETTLPLRVPGPVAATNKAKSTTSLYHRHHRYSPNQWMLLLLAAAVTVAVGTISYRLSRRRTSTYQQQPSQQLREPAVPETISGHRYEPYGERTLLADAKATYYSPSLLTATDPSEVHAWKEDWNSTLIHIVHTRFMQEQYNLTVLGQARFHLFKIFCLPTMIQQSSQNFVWIIKTDPRLDPDMLRQLAAELLPYPNFYLVSSLQNFRISKHDPGAWRGGAEPRELAGCPVHTGDRRRLELAMALHSELPVLETRLDADDGLHLLFIEVLQQMAVHSFTHHKELKWMYWCSRRHMEWHWLDLNVMERTKEADYEYGALFGTRHDHFCITPGVTVGFPVGIDESAVPIYAHDRIVVTIRDELTREGGCGLATPSKCLQFVEHFVFCAIRSRTPTSAGMLHVADKTLVDPRSWLNYAYWEMVHDSFGLRREQMKQMNRYLVDHLVSIAQENLLGQCTAGHSCKEKAKKELQKLLAIRRNSSIVVAAANR